MTIESRPVSAATIFRQKLANGEFILAPGVYDGFSARVALEVGFDALYMVQTQHQQPSLLVSEGSLMCSEGWEC